MKTGLRRIVARCAATTLVGAAAFSSATAAQAHTLGTQIGTATLNPSSGLDTDAPTVSSSGACPAAASNVQLVLYGAGLPDGQLNVSANYMKDVPPLNAAGGYDVAMQDTFQALGQQQAPPVVYSGVYKMALICTNATGIADFGDFDASVTFSDSTHWTSTVAVVATATSTSLAVSPATSATAGGPVMLTATVGPAGAAGSVQFFDGTAALGSTAVAGSTATLTTSALAVGAHSLTATFTPTAPAGATPSTSAAVPYAVTAPILAPAVSHPSAFVFPVGTKVTCPGGQVLAVPAAAIGKAINCNAGGAYVFVAEGPPPHALVAPSLSGTGKVGSKLVLKPGIWTPVYSTRTVVWKRDGKVIAKQSGGSYVVKKTDKGHKISATVIAHLAGHIDGTSSTAPVKTKALRTSILSSTSAVLDGVAGDSTPLGVPVGSVIGCIKGDFTGATTVTSGWLVDGKPYVADLALIVPDALVGHQLVCRTTAVGPGGTTNSDAVVTIGVGAKIAAYVVPKIAGVAKVGKKLSTTAGKWYPVQAKATFVWLRNGVAIKGATKATYVLAKADKKQKISVRVTVTRTGWVTGKAVSAAVSVG